MLLFLPLLSVSLGSDTVGGLIEFGKALTVWFGDSQFNQIFVGTSDGLLHDIDLFSGDILWSVDTGGTISGSSLGSDSCHTPSLDGYLFSQGSTNRIIRWPVPIRDLSKFQSITLDSEPVFPTESHKSMTINSHDGSIITGAVFYQPGNIRVTRIDYQLLFRKGNEVVRWSELTIKHPNFVPHYMHSIRVTTSFDGWLYFFVNNTYNSKVYLTGFPVSVWGSLGRFKFATESRGQPSPPASVLLLKARAAFALAVPAASDQAALAPYTGHRRLAIDSFADGLVAPHYILSVDLPARRHFPSVLFCGLIAALALFYFTDCRSQPAPTVRNLVRIPLAGKTGVQTLHAIFGIFDNIESVAEENGYVLVQTGESGKWRQQLKSLPVFADPGLMLADCLEEVTRGEKVITELKRHPVFWDIETEIVFVAKLAAARFRLEKQINSRSQNVFGGSWKRHYQEFTEEYRGFIQIEEAHGFLGHDTVTLVGLVGYIGKKLGHAQTSVRIARIRGSYGQAQMNLFEFLIRPFPTLILETYRLFEDSESVC
jgi:hypothetical protein